jgi:hypothetical protein
VSQFAFPGATQTIKRVCRKCFIFGVFSPSSALAEREGLPRHASKINKINSLQPTRMRSVYQSYVLKSSLAWVLH